MYDEMKEPTTKQLKDLCIDIMSGRVMTIEAEHYHKLEQEIARLKDLAIFIVVINKHTGECRVTPFEK